MKNRQWLGSLFLCVALLAGSSSLTAEFGGNEEQALQLPVFDIGDVNAHNVTTIATEAINDYLRTQTEEQLDKSRAILWELGDIALAQDIKSGKEDASEFHKVTDYTLQLEDFAEKIKEKKHVIRK